MAYYFMVEEKKGTHIPLDIKKSKYFTKQSKFKKLGLSLQEIDLFTTMFDNEFELRTNLVKEGILSSSLVTKPLSARILRQNVYHKVMYDFLYQKDIDYLVDPNNLIARINDKLNNDDFRFISALSSAYLKFYDCSSTAAEVRNHANMSIYSGMRSHYFDELDDNGDTLLTRMIKLLIYEYYQYPSGNIVYKNDIKYLNLHSLIAFTNNYDKKHNNDDEENNIFTEVTNIKTKKRKKVIPGQLGITEIIK